MHKASITGFVVETESKGSYLTEGLFWFDHDKIKNAYVHSRETIDQLPALSKEWEFKPARLYPATYRESLGTRVTGEPIKFPLHKIE